MEVSSWTYRKSLATNDFTQYDPSVTAFSTTYVTNGGKGGQYLCSVLADVNSEMTCHCTFRRFRSFTVTWFTGIKLSSKSLLNRAAIMWTAFYFVYYGCSLIQNTLHSPNKLNGKLHRVTVKQIVKGEEIFICLPSADTVISYMI